MRISDLRECIVLAETRSFTETARRLFTTQSALSKHIQALEGDLGVQLFLRNQNGVYLTRAGKVFVGSAREILRKYEESIDALDRLKSGVEETLNIGYLAGAGFAVLPEAFNRFNARFPNIDIQPKTMEIDEVDTALDSGDIDLGVTTEFVPFSNSRFEKRTLYQDHVSVIVPLEHRLAARESVRIADLANETILLSNPTFMVREAPKIESLLAPISDKIVVKKDANDIMSIFLLMMTRRYVTILFDHIRNFSDFTKRFRFLPLEEYPDHFDIVAIWKRSMRTDAIVGLADAIQEVVLEQAGPGDFISNK